MREILKYIFMTKYLKKVLKVAVLQSLCSDIGPDSVYSKEIHSALD